MKKTTKKSKPVETEWGACDVCGALTPWPGEGVSCDNETDDGLCDGVYVPSDENGRPL